MNYQKELDRLIERLKKEEKAPSLLLHSCCAPCSSYCLEYLSQYFHITVDYYNPNIYPEEEYHMRVQEQQRLIRELPAKYPISFISGEYLGWNAKNLTLINCTIESLQGMCYIENLVMKNCRLIHTALAFEYSTVDAQIQGKIDSVLNPSGGIIRTDEIGELIIEKDKVDPAKTRIICQKDGKFEGCVCA